MEISITQLNINKSKRNQSIHQPIKPTNQPTNQSTNQTKQPINTPTNPSISKSTNQKIIKAIKRNMHVWTPEF